MKILIPLLGMLPLCFGSCNPSKQIVMENETSDSARVSWYVKKDSLHKTAFSLENDNKAEFLLAPGNRIATSVGGGNWKIDSIKNLTRVMDSVELNWKGGKIVLRDEDEMLDFFKIRRHGLFKQKLLVRMNDN